MSNAQDGFLRNCLVWLPWSFLIQMCSEIYYAKLSMTISKEMFHFLKYTYFFLHFTEFIKNISHSSVLFWSSNIARLQKALSPCQGWSRTIVVNNAFFSRETQLNFSVTRASPKGRDETLLEAIIEFPIIAPFRAAIIDSLRFHHHHHHSQCSQAELIDEQKKRYAFFDTHNGFVFFLFERFFKFAYIPFF